MKGNGTVNRALPTALGLSQILFMSYFLMNKDNIIATLNPTYSDLFKDVSFKPDIISGRLPFGMSENSINQDINSWIDSRKASKHNGHLKRLMHDMGCDTRQGFISVTHAASINDTFWIKKDDESINWSDISFYKNQFNETISKLAFEGLGLYEEKFSSTSPELTTDGSFRKCWKLEDDGIFLYKRGTDGFANTGKEPYSEVLASEIANAVCKNSVRYQLVLLHNEIASKCRSFCTEDLGFSPIANFNVPTSSLMDNYNFYSKNGFEDDFRRMMVFDAITFNIDRHSGNHGVLFDTDTMEIQGFAPCFDFNLAMLPYAMEDDLENIEEYTKDKFPSIGNSFIENAKLMLTDSIRSDLKNLSGFTFSMEPSEKFTQKRIQQLNAIVNDRINEILGK